MKPRVTEVVVCDTRKTGLGTNRNRNDREDARGLARLMYRGELESVYHGEHGLRTSRELARTHLAIGVGGSLALASRSMRFADKPGTTSEEPVEELSEHKV